MEQEKKIGDEPEEDESYTDAFGRWVREKLSIGRKKLKEID